MVHTIVCISEQQQQQRGGGASRLLLNATSATFAVPIILQVYTVATLPSGTVGMMAYVSDALGPVYAATVVGGGAVKTPVFYDGTNWTVH